MKHTNCRVFSKPKLVKTESLTDSHPSTIVFNQDTSTLSHWHAVMEGFFVLHYYSCYSTSFAQNDNLC